MSTQATRLATLIAITFLSVGCPHRTPVWSPSGERIAVLAGQSGEEIDKAASRLYLVDPAGRKAQLLTAPEPGLRYLSAVWADESTLVVLTGKWDSGFVASGTEKIWKVTENGKRWASLAAPPPAESNAVKRPPVIVGAGSSQALAYPSDAEAVVVVSLAEGKELLRLDPAELVGPAPGGGVLVSRPQAEDPSTIEVAALGPDLKVLWRKKLSDLRDGVAARLGKKPVEVVFNTTSTSELSSPGEAAELGVNLIFSDVGWKEGIPGYHVRLDSGTGNVLGAVRNVGLSGRPGVAGGFVWAVLAPSSKEKLPVRLAGLSTTEGRADVLLPLAGVEKEDVQGYARDPSGKRLALSLGGKVRALRIYEREKLEAPVVIELGE